MMRLSSALAALAMAAACATATRPDPHTEGARLLADMKLAVGGAKLDTLSTYHASGRRVRDGKLAGTFDDWGDMRLGADVTRETFDGVTTRGGYDGKVSWSAGPDGAVRVETDPKQLDWARLGAYINAQGYLFPDRSPATFEFRGEEKIDGKPYDVVTITLGAASVDMWIDRATHLLFRLTGANGPIKHTVEVEQYATVDGVKVVRRAMQTMEAGGQTHTELQDIEIFRFEPVPPEQLAPPR